MKTKKPVFGRCKNKHELWVPLIEKAYAKMHGCYENLISGYVDEGIQELTGMQPEKIFIRDETSGVFPHKMIAQHYGGSDGFWKFLMDRDNDNCLMGCSIKGNGKEGELILDGAPCGLILNHAYGINDIFEIKCHKSGEMHKLLRLRNPWGNSEWKGAWSGDSEEVKIYRPQLEAYVHSLPPDEQFDLDADDGTFFIPYEDWKDNFSTLFLNLDFPDEWTGLRFVSAWTKSNSGGLPTSYEKAHLEEFAKNPQFVIRPAANAELMFSVTQAGGRLPQDGQYYTYPFPETLHYAAVGVFKLAPGETHLSCFDKDRLVYMSPIKREKEISGRCKLEAGESYVIVPSTELAKKKGKFFLSVYINQRLRDVYAKRVFHPLDKNTAKDEVLPFFIPEEAEKLASQAPLWKIQLVKESLKYMMTDEDGGALVDSD